MRSYIPFTFRAISLHAAFSVFCIHMLIPPFRVILKTQMCIRDRFTICADRSADISRLSYQGINLSYFSVCGYTAPTYYDKTGLNFLKSFNCGFLTTCGVQSMGSPSEYEGTEYGLHGTMSHTPADQVSYDISENGDITVTAKMTDACIFNQKISLVRTYHCRCV